MSISSISRRDIEEIHGLENGAPATSVSQHLMVHTNPARPLVSISAIVTLGSAVYLLLLLRFPQIISSQINQLHEAFARAIAEGYRGQYRGVSPSRSISGRAQIVRAAARMIMVWRWGEPEPPPP
jgi:arginine decarboxylase-like protein